MLGNMEMDPADLNKQRVKKDVLWKPLLRGFRSYYRSLFAQNINLLKTNDTNAQDMENRLER